MGGAAKMLALVAFPTLSLQLQHPSGFFSLNDIARVRSRVAAREEPWWTAYQTLMGDASLTASYKPSPFTVVSRDITTRTHKANNTGCHELEQDSMAAYYFMVRWIANQSDVWPNAAMRIIDSWSGKLKGFQGHDQMLAAGIYGSHFAQAAELLAHAAREGVVEWPLEDRARGMFRDVFHPVCKYFCGGDTQSVQRCDHGANGNWDASCMVGVASWAVFLDNATMLATVSDYFRNGRGNGRLVHYIYPSGQAQESGRDQAHTQDGLEHLLETALVVYTATGDASLFTLNNSRLLTGLEYTARYNLNMTVPFTPNCDVYNISCFSHISNISRGQFAPMWEMAAAAYGASAAPFSSQIVQRTGYRPEGKRPPIIHGGAHVGDGPPGLGTLCFYGMDLPTMADSM